jgi:hypothetical protein
LEWGGLTYAKHDDYVETSGTASCATAACHGPELGGVPGSGPSCATACHMGSLDSVHPVEWYAEYYNRTYVMHDNYVFESGTTQCANGACHGVDLQGVPESGPSCATACHMGGVYSQHPPMGAISYASIYGDAGCAVAACHGVNLQGGAGPGCDFCH